MEKKGRCKLKEFSKAEIIQNPVYENRLEKLGWDLNTMDCFKDYERELKGRIRYYIVNYLSNIKCHHFSTYRERYSQEIMEAAQLSTKFNYTYSLMDLLDNYELGIVTINDTVYVLPKEIMYDFQFIRDVNHVSLGYLRPKISIPKRHL